MMGYHTAGAQLHRLTIPASLSPWLPLLLALHNELLCSDIRSFRREASSHGRKEKSLEPKLMGKSQDPKGPEKDRGWLCSR